MERLPDDSLTAALASGGREFFGWGMDRHMQADIFDAINQNTRACGNWGKKPPKINPRPRPAIKRASKVGVVDIYRRLQGG